MALTRRELLHAALAAPLLRGVGQASGEERSAGLDLPALTSAPGRVDCAPERAQRHVRLIRDWDGPLCRSRIVNDAKEPVRVKQVVLFDLAHGLPAATPLYGEGFQMLSQTGGTLGQPKDLGDYSDAGHYRLPQPETMASVYNLMTLALADGSQRLLAFTSCRRFSGRFDLAGAALLAVLDTEGLELKPGETWELEEFYFGSGPDRERLLADLAQRVSENHPPLPFPQPPTGWCSWYCFGPRVTDRQVLDNLDVIARDLPGLRYVQIDDGYQPAMGDWLETGPAFGGNVRRVLEQIRARGFEPALWVAPFIAEQGSHLFEQHPGWLIKDADGRPLAADRVSFGGWRRGPWYALDGTHPEVQQHFESLFRTLRREWGCTYFKLDANFWGALHGGRFHDPRATRIEAYRRGMQAIRRGAGEAFILGCNHPLWPSLGLVHGSRSSNDIKRAWARVAGTARQNLNRNWQNGRLWWNDADAVVLTGLGDEEILFHATAVYATGGMLLSGDDLSRIGPDTLALLRKLQPPTGVAARFEDETLRVGRLALPDRSVVCVLNWDDAARTQSFEVAGPLRVRELWTGQDHGRVSGPFTARMPPRSGRIFVCTRDATT